MTETVKVRFLNGSASLPRRGSERAAGFDLFACEQIEIPGSVAEPEGRVTIGRALVPTGLAMAIPSGCYGRIAPRSGLAVRNGIDVGGGVIDADYRHEVKILLFNFTADAFLIRPGERIAQIIFERICEPAVERVDALDETGRTGGFGSTGL